MVIHKAKTANYDSVRSDCICDYIRKYAKKIEEMTSEKNPERLENANRAQLKSVAAELETVVKRLEYALNGRY